MQYRSENTETLALNRWIVSEVEGLTDRPAGVSEPVGNDLVSMRREGAYDFFGGQMVVGRIE